MSALPSDATGPVLISRNPATGEDHPPLPAHTPDDIAAMVRRARKAQVAWGARSAKERAKILLRLRDLAIDEQDHVAATVRMETGKPTIEALVHAAAALEPLSYYPRMGRRLAHGKRASPGFLLHKSLRTHYRPKGVAAVISPWNYPFFLAMLHIVPALMAGNAVIHKPSEHTPRTGLLIGDLARRAGVPDDVLQIAVGAGDVGAALVDAPVDVVSFTGAPSTGSRVMAAAAKHLTPVILELGGKDAAIVAEDADLDRAIEGITWGAFINAGQTCVAVKRAIVHESLYDVFVSRLAENARQLRPGAAPDAQMGPLVLEREIERIERQVKESVAMGARLVAGGRRIAGPGSFFEPTVLADCTPDMPAVREETFGPLLTILRARDDAQALELANDCEYGLGGSVWTRSRRRASKLVAGMKTGGVCVNDVIIQAGLAGVAFGGVKRSGIGRAGTEQGYIAYTDPQAEVASWLYNPTHDLLWYPYNDATLDIIKRFTGLYHGSLRTKLRRILGRY